MIKSGLVSITFRQLSPAEILALVDEAGLDGIEWGGDVHVPHGDSGQATKVRQMTLDAGLAVAAYGSYYRVGHAESGPFEAVLASAVALGAPIIRVWAGMQGSDTADEAYWALVVEDSRRIATMAASEGIVVAYEFHGNTLTDTTAAAHQLLTRVAHEQMQSYWQPPKGSALAENLLGIEAVSPWLQNVHVFSWDEETFARLPLSARAKQWQAYLQKIAALNRDLFAMLEFVQNDAPVSFLRDAATLKAWLQACN